MSLDATQTPTRSDGLRTVVDTIASPGEAFDALRERPTWGWAALILALACAIGFVLGRPAQNHAAYVFMQHFISSPSAASITDDKKRQMLEQAQNPTLLQGIQGFVTTYASYFLAALFNALFLLLGNAIGRGSARFSTLWAASVNIAVPTLGISSIVLGLITMLRGPQSFNGMIDIMHALPGLGMFVPSLGGFAGGFLTSIQVFAIWGCVLNAIALKRASRVDGAVAYVIPIAILIFGGAMSGAMFALFAKLSGS